MTLMACYGAPVGLPTDSLDDFGDEFGDGDMEVCAQTPIVDLGSEPTTVDGSAANGTSTNQGSCGGVGREQVFLWTPSVGGSYRFTTDGQADLVLYVRTERDTCGFEAACADEVMDAESIDLEVIADQPLFIVVDHADADAGSQFSLTIESSS